MIGVVTAILAGFGRKAALLGALAVAIVVALWVAFRRGRFEGAAEYIIRRADARVRSMQTAKEVRSETRNADGADLDARADRWMRD